MKIANANICLNDDTLFTGEECPQCLGRSYYPLRKWLVPLQSFDEIKEARFAKRNLQIQEGSANSLLNTVDIPTHTVIDPSIIEEYLHRFPTSDKISFDRDYKSKPSEFEIDKSDYPSGKPMESKSSIEEGSKRVDAGNAFFSKIFRIFKGRFKMPRKKHSGGYCNSKVLSEDQPKLASSFE